MTKISYDAKTAATLVMILHPRPLTFDSIVKKSQKMNDVLTEFDIKSVVWDILSEGLAELTPTRRVKLTKMVL